MLDALPLPSWLPLLSKLFALIGLQAVMLAVVMLCGMLIQVLRGYFNLEPALYLYSLFLIQWPQYALLAVLAISVQVLVNQKYVAYFVMIIYFVATISFSSLGLDHPMVLYATFPRIIYSEMNGFGAYLGRERWFELYWFGMALVLVALSLLFWARGSNTELASRIQLARRRLVMPVIATLGAGLFVFFGAGGILLYNLHVEDSYETAWARDARLAEYERRYKRYATTPQPRILDVRIRADLKPETRSMTVRGSYQLENRSGKPIGEIFISQDRSARPQLKFSVPVRPSIDDPAHGFYSYTLARPMAPGERIKVDFTLAWEPHGILGFSSDTPVLSNGTFFNSDLMPHIGYLQIAELKDDHDRKRHGLEERAPMPQPDDPRGLANNYVSSDADWINFDAVISTSPDQIAVAPGLLEKEWMEGGRRHFHYQMDKPILHYYSIQSARYEVRHDRWQDVTLDIYYHPGHTWNLDRMIRGMQAGLDYNARNFSPYQHKTLRIVEFPRYAKYAQSYPNTIPYSEDLGFIARVDEKNPKDIDYPFYVTAHEVAHQWWGHQIVGGATRGATVLSETLSQYAALMAMKDSFGPERMRRFLRYELDRYMFGRAVEKKRELPLAQNENEDYIHYSKGSLVMYRLQDILGEEGVNQVLRQLLRDAAFQVAPYPSVNALTSRLLAAAAPSQRQQIEDLFNAIVLYDNRATAAEARRLKSGEHEVTLTVYSSKLRSAELGEEREEPINEFVEFGVDGVDGKPLLREMRRVTGGEMTVRLLVHGKPVKAGIDPDNKLIDRKPDDNLIKVEVGP
jgi:hypothetical protein